MLGKTAILLHNIRSVHNVGSIFRTADAAGVSQVYLSGYTPAPLDRFGRARKDLAKVSLGAERVVPWSHEARVQEVFKKLRADGWRIIAVEQASSARNYRTFHTKRPTCFVFGNEVRGLSPSVLRQCDAIVEIPMRGTKESLNVAVAVGIVLFAIR
jgi:tRNA G18 (ribose-2'-O)-methylase SpoU